MVSYSMRKILHKQKLSGFTLVELIVVISIAVIISGISLYQFYKQRAGSTIQSTAEEIALNIRQAQSNALAVRSTGGLVPVYQNGYGIYFSLTPGTNPQQDATPTSYVSFIDYTATGSSSGWDRAYLESSVPKPCGNPMVGDHECIEKISLPTGDRITSLEVCNATCATTSILAVSFVRPNLDAYFCTTPTTAAPPGCSSSPYSYIKINISSTGQTASDALTRSIYVWSTGQVSIQ